MERGNAVEAGALGNDDGSTRGHKLQPADNRLLSTSSFHHFTHSPFASVNFLCLEGVTELESGTDWDCATEGPHDDIIMRETWETLCELGAFLQQVSAGGACKTRCMDQVFSLSGGTTQKRGSSIQKRVREVEARIRQAGLTPPSLMKRSASLAKLGCLELLANDLSEWEFSRSSVSLPSAQPPTHMISDESKKQRVNDSPVTATQHPEVLGVGVEMVSEAGETSLEISPPPKQRQQIGKPQIRAAPAVTLTPRGRAGPLHPARVTFPCTDRACSKIDGSHPTPTLLSPCSAPVLSPSLFPCRGVSRSCPVRLLSKSAPTPGGRDHRKEYHSKE
ncbi:hypothetical protein INR49_011349 [Caranx melampygus]|nr:hypothetical protein INR49_011349 [Caranx melampygus]